jgi:hypothetical protein
LPYFNPDDGPEGEAVLNAFSIAFLHSECIACASIWHQGLRGNQVFNSRRSSINSSSSNGTGCALTSMLKHTAASP